MPQQPGTESRIARAPRWPALAVLLALGGCGQTGPLYLPEDETSTVITRPAGADPPDSTPAAPAEGDAPPRRGAPPPRP